MYTVHCHMYTVHMYTYLEKIYIIIRLTERNHNTTLDCSRTVQSLSCRGCTDPSLSRGWSERNTSWRVLSCSRCSRYSLKLPLWITRLKGYWMRQMKNVIDWLNLFIIDLNRLSYYQTCCFRIERIILTTNKPTNGLEVYTRQFSNELQILR